MAGNDRRPAAGIAAVVTSPDWVNKRIGCCVRGAFDLGGILSVLRGGVLVPQFYRRENMRIVDECTLCS